MNEIDLNKLVFGCKKENDNVVCVLEDKESGKQLAVFNIDEYGGDVTIFTEHGEVSIPEIGAKIRYRGRPLTAEFEW